MSPSITDDILAQLRGGSLAQISQELGTDEQQTESAIGTALPFLLGALGRNAENPAGAQQLFGAIERDHMPLAAGSGGGLDLGDLLGTVLGGAGGGAGAGGLGGLGGLLGGLLGEGGGSAAPASKQFNAEGILGHILGGKQSRAEDGLAQATGLSGNNMHKLLLMLAPIVMGYLGRQVSSGQASSADALGSLLGSERQQVQQQGGMAGGLLGAVLDQDGDGKLDLGDLLKLGGQFLGGGRR